MATPYIGNNDYRGWLSYLANSGSRTAADLLNYAGNDGGVSDRNASVYYTTGQNGQDINAKAGQVNDTYYGQWKQQQGDNQVIAQDNPETAAAKVVGKKYSSSLTDTAAAKQAAQEAEEKRQKQRMIDYYNGMISQKNSAIDDLEGSLKNSLDEIEGNYKTYANEQQSAFNKAKSEYDNSSKQNLQSLITNRNTITDNAAHGLRGLMRVIGAMGAGGGSVARYNAPDAIKAQADQENAGAGLTYAQNQANLDTDWGNYKNDWENDKKKLEDWKTSETKKAKQDIEKQRINLLEQLSELYGNRATYGTDLGNSISDITNRVKAANQAIKDLGTYTAPQYNGITAVYEAKPLSGYDTGASDLTTTVQDNGSSGSTNLLSVLRSLRRKNQSNPYSSNVEA